MGKHQFLLSYSFFRQFCSWVAYCFRKCERLDQGGYQSKTLLKLSRIMTQQRYGIRYILSGTRFATVVEGLKRKIHNVVSENEDFSSRKRKETRNEKQNIATYEQIKKKSTMVISVWYVKCHYSRFRSLIYKLK